MSKRAPWLRRAGKMAGPVAAALDQAVVQALAAGRELMVAPRLDTELVVEAERALELLMELEDTQLFPSPEAPHSAIVTRVGARTVDVSWPSSHRPVCDWTRPTFESSALNQICRARLFGAAAKRPVAVLVHGYMAGTFSLEQRLWPLKALDRAGFDVALFTLPFHGARSERSFGSTPVFPSADPGLSVEGFRQAVADLRALLAWLRWRGHPSVGLLGMSLGGYTAALAATLEEDLAFLVPVVPLACLVQFSSEQRRTRGRELSAEHQALLHRAYRGVSPLARAPRISGERVLVVAGKADRITPASHARKLAHHFSARLAAWSGGHLLQFGRAEVWDEVLELLRRTRP